MLGRRFWFFSNVNPTMYFSGFEGETKEEMFRQLPPEFCPATIYIEPGEPIEQVLNKMSKAGLSFPVAAKPDVGTKGLLFRIGGDVLAALLGELVPTDWGPL